MLVLLDRDGVINKDLPNSVTSLDDFQLLPGVGRSIACLNKAKIKVAVVTNQACVGRGDLSAEGLESIHQKMQQLLKKDNAYIDKIYVCTDTKILPNNRRKPAPGMILEAMQDFNTIPRNTVMIGDADRDLEAATAAGCHKILVLTGKGKLTYDTIKSNDCSLIVHKNLPSAIDFLLTTPLENSGRL